MNDENGKIVYTNPRHRKRIVTANWEIIIEPGEQEIIIRAKGQRLARRHDRLLEALANELVAQGYKVRADGVNVPSHARLNITLTIGRARIDLISFDGIKYEYWEVKTLPELATDHTRRQLLEYSHELKHFNLVVPPEAKDRAKDLLSILNIWDKCRLVVIHPENAGDRASLEIVEKTNNESDIYIEGLKPEW